MSKSHKLCKPVKIRKCLKLQWLPVLARNEVVRSMDIKDIVMLSLSSSKMEGMIRYAKVKVSSIELHVNISNSILKIVSLNQKMYHCGPDQRKKGSNKLVPPIFSRWIDKDCTSFQNCVSIFKRLQNITIFESLCLHVDLKVMTVPFFKEILTEPALKDFEYLCLDRGKIEAESLDLVMEMAHSNRDIHIMETRIPINYYHEKAFKFYDMAYWDARWVCIEDLLTLKNRYAVRLSWINLTFSDLNTYIKFWIENDYDMVKLLSLYTRAPIQPEILFDGIVVLQGRRRNFDVYLVAANPTKQRKHQIMGVAEFNNGINLFSNDIPLRVGEEMLVESWEAEYKVLKVLNKKKELEKELKEIEKDTQDRNTVEKKNDISRDLQNVSIELASYNLVFRDGFYSYM